MALETFLVMSLYLSAVVLVILLTCDLAGL